MEKFIYAVRDTKTNTDVVGNKSKKYYTIKGHAERIVKKENKYYDLEPRYKLVIYKLIEAEF